MGAQISLCQAYDTVKEKTLTNKINRIKRAQNDNVLKLSTKLINKMSGRMMSRQGRLEGDTTSDRVRTKYNYFLWSPWQTSLDWSRWRRHRNNTRRFENWYGVFTISEYQKAKKVIVEGKASGEGDFPHEVLKRCGYYDEILDLCNRALFWGQKAKQLFIMNILLITKAGYLSKGGNYRDISLSSLLAKSYNMMILSRIRPAIDLHLRNNQNGFRPGRTATSQIRALHRIIEGFKENLRAIKHLS